MTVSIVIPAKSRNNNLEECLNACLGIKVDGLEIIVVTDDPAGCSLPDKRIKFISSGPLSPAEKRDLAAAKAGGDILAFIDDDVCPSDGWLINALKEFSDPLVAAVAGPAVTPERDSFLQRAGGLVYSSLLVGGTYRYRYVPGHRRLVDDYPSCNFLVRKSVFNELGGFNTKFWPGEDTKLCLDITKKLGRKIVYDPEVLVFHHRRPLFLPHLKQVSSYGLHRGYFAKRFPQTSLRLSYFLPSLLVMGIFFGAAASFMNAKLAIVYLLGVLIYGALVFVASIYYGPLTGAFVFLGTILTHIVYGVYFLRGLITNKLKEEL